MAKYRLMGTDRFEYEDYEIGTYDTYEEAYKVKLEKMSHPNGTSGMEDTYEIIAQAQCKHCDATFFGFGEMVDHGLRKHHDIMRELGYSEKQLIYEDC